MLDTETVSSFHAGVYLNWQVSGNVVITITQAGRDQRRPQRAVHRPDARHVRATFRQAGHDDAGQLDRDLRHAGLRRHRQRDQPPLLRHRHARRPDDLHLGRQHDRPPCPPGRRRHRPHRRRWYSSHQLHGGRGPDRRPDARPGALLRRLGQHRPERAGPDQQRRHGGRAGYRDGLVVPRGGLPAIGRSAGTW